ncbi:hypothetical protein HYPSUDRAFT_205192 [Hypholoma sublateritium FD-334 SS-4]|uniref:Uncharacterized protein n=1 Tax=Hypholoma sublateritium (strain FD-334 SS-4) TaxID=945553 RepID=A0A0D2NPH0_HYPSF|nr:hypothetical protein HYPSUDRAFT_205192 [Hypholoma sublateritium FD-334 SS-4]
MAITVITIDDRSPEIKYKGFWTQGGRPGDEFNGTTTWTNSAKSIATIQFWGSQISVFGTIPANGSALSPTTSYSIDNGTPQVVSKVQNAVTQFQHLFFQSNDLPPSNHTLIITNLVPGGYFYLDFVNITNTTTTPTMAPAELISSFLTKSTISASSSSWISVSPTPSVDPLSSPLPTPIPSSSTAPGLTIIDDRNPSFSYHGNWQEGSMSSDVDGTFTWTNTSGSSVLISFAGIQINVYGSTPNVMDGFALNASYSIDGMPPRIYRAGEQQTGLPSPQLLFQSDELDSGNHTLCIENLTEGGDYVLDYAAISVGNFTLSPSLSAANSAATSVETSMTPIAASSTSTSSSETGPIVGGVIGGLGLIALLVIGSLILKRCRKGWKEEMVTSRNSVQKTLAVTPPSEAASSMSEYKSETGSATGKSRYLRVQTASYQSTVSAVSSGLEYIDDPSGSTYLEMRRGI